MNDNQQYVITWMTSDGFDDADGFGIRHTTRRMDGTTIQSERETNTTTAGNQRFPAVAITSSGAYIIVWESDGDIRGQLYTSAGVTNGSELLINTTTDSLQSYPDVVMDAAGNFVVVWQSTAQDGDGTGVYARRYNASGVAQDTNEFQVSSNTAGNQQEPSVAMDDSGNFVVAWSDYNRDGSEYGIYAQRYNSDGSTNGSNFRVNSTTSNNQLHPDVAMSSGGNFSIVWASWGIDSDQAGVYMQSYNAEGDDKEAQTQVNTNETNFQTLPAVAMDADIGKMYVVWQGGENGNPSTQDEDDFGIFTQAFDVADLENPIAVANNVTLYLDNVGDDKLTVAMVEGGSSDNIGIVSTTISKSNFDCGDIGDNNVTLTVTDAAGNTGTAIAVITVLDTLSPTVGGRNLTVYLDAVGTASITVSDANNSTSTDNCGITLEGFTQDTFTCDDVGSNTVGFFGYDPSGNYDTAFITVTVLDTITPSLTPVDLTVYLDNSGSATLFSTDLYTGASDNCSSGNIIASDTVFDCSEVGANVISFTDGSGNSPSGTATVTVIDSVSPSAVAQDLTVYLDGSGSASISYLDVDNGSSDNCSALNYVLSDSLFGCVDTGANVITLTVTDGSGNQSTANATITVLDSISPTMAARGSLTVYLGSGGAANISAADLDNGSSDNCNISSYTASQTAFDCTDVGTIPVTFTIADPSGNQSSTSVNIVVVDSVKPSVTAVTVNADLDATGNVTVSASSLYTGVSDNCAVATIVVSDTTFDCTSIGDNLVDITVTDVNGNQSTVQSTVTVSDATAPTVLGQNLTVYLDAAGSITISEADVDNGSTDNCSLELSLSQSTFTCSDLGANAVTLTGFDAGGNQDSANVTITVIDSIAPTLSVQNATIYLDIEGYALLSFSDIDVSSFDNCSFTESFSQDEFYCADLGENLVTVTLTDPAGNTTMETVTITVVDSISPEVVTQNVTVTLDASGSATLTPEEVNLDSYDVCGIESMVLSQTSFACSDIGTITVTLTVTDSSGNSSTGTAQVTVNGGVNFNGPEDCDLSQLIVSLDLDTCAGTVAYNSVTDGANGTVSGADWRGGYLNQGLSLDGVDDYISLGSDSSLAFTTSFSVSMWVKTSTNGKQWLIGRNQDGSTSSWMIRLNNGITEVFMGGLQEIGPYKSTTSVADGTWHHLTTTYGNDTITVYIDGAQNAQYTVPAGSLNANYGQEVWIGKRNNADPQAFDGMMDEIQIYAAALGANQVSYLAGFEEAPVACPADDNSVMASFALDDCGSTTLTNAADDTSVGVIAGDTYIAGGYNNQAIWFDGVDDNANLNDSAYTIGEAFSYSFWVFPTKSNGSNEVLLYRNEASISNVIVLNNLLPRVYLGGLSNPGYHNANTPLTVNTWSHIGVTYEGGIFTLYINGVADKTVTGLSGSLNFTTSGTHYIGARPDGNRPFQGAIDEIRIFNEALEAQTMASEVTRIANSPVPCPDDIIGAWLFDDCGETTATDSLGLNNGTIVGATPGTGYTGAGMEFDGTNDYINIGTSSDFELSDEFTIAMWVNTTQSARYAVLMAKNRDGSNFSYQVMLNNGQPVISLGGTTNVGPHQMASNIATGTWTHIAWRLQDNTLTGFVNGIPVYTATVNGALNANSGSPLWLGGRNDKSDRYFAGSLDEVKIWSNGLDNSEISALANEAQNSSGCTVSRGDLSDDFAATIDVALYPNPNKGSFVLQWPDAPSEAVTIEMTNSLGQTVYRHEGTVTTQHEISLRDPSSGVYFLSIVAGEKRFAERVVIK
ncbi:MAG: LamG-like jellyroll fold domain-containing protein [Bacteroidota bacterium]